MVDVMIGGAGDDHKDRQKLLLKLANRHGLVAGATGTGKTVTLQILAEGFSDAGVPVFMADVKGDLSGLCETGNFTSRLGVKLLERADKIGFDDYAPQSFPTVFWDVFGEQGHPIRTTVSEMGPLLLARLLELSEAQEGVLNILFRLADEDGLPIVDLKDLQAMLVEIGERAGELRLRYGNVSRASIGAIQRKLLILENQGGDAFFGEPALRLEDMMATAPDGRGRVNILAADKLMHSPRLYATFLLWLLSELFEELPEVGDPDRPVLVFFFDEAHLLFDDAPKALVERIEQVARLIRSKGVGVYFITQNPADLPETVLGQLGNRIQHALRAYTPREQKAVRAAADTFRPNPAFDTREVLPQLGVGEALVSTLGEKGVPGVVARTLVRPPSSTLGPARPESRAAAFGSSPLKGVYEQVVDRESAYEMLAKKAEAAAREAERAEGEGGDDPFAQWNRGEDVSAGVGSGRRYRPAAPAPKPPARRRRRSDTPMEAFTKSLARSVASQAGRAIVRGVLGGLFRGR